MLSIVIPLAPGEQAWRGLASRLAAAEEVILVSPESGRASPPARWIVSPAGRAKQLNAGAAAARGHWLWFVHADTRLSAEAIEKAQAVARTGERALYYFDLRFADDGARWMPLNAFGANLRSRFLKMPFGDQGFLIRRDLFFALGGFAEDVAYGEDHVFAWAARRARVPILRARESITTSARKYRERGWASTTARHLALTYRQAAGELRKSWAPRRSPKQAVVFFVKTPGFSPVKTRLRTPQDPDLGERFYQLSLRAISELARDLRARGFAPYWAVAEQAALAAERWREFPRVAQGEGELGARLGRVYRELIARHRQVFFLGGDCPQVSALDVERASEALGKSDFVFGPARDGGFYLFGGRRYLEGGSWRGIAYSRSTTLRELSARLEQLGRVARLPMKTDVDEPEDLLHLRAELQAAEPAHYAPRQWELLRTI